MHFKKYIVGILVLGGLLRSGSHVFANGLVAEWRFEEGTGTVAIDSKGMLTGNIRYGITWTGGYYGNAVYFNGTGNVVNILNANNLFTLTGAITVASRVYPTQRKGTSENGYLLGMANDLFFIIDTNYNAEGMGGNNTFSIFLNRYDNKYILDSEQQIPLNQWSHLAMTYDKSAGKVYLYINGSTVKSGPYNLPITYDSSNATIGCSSLGINGCGPWRGFPGKIDDVLIYDYALSAKEIMGLYDISKKSYILGYQNQSDRYDLALRNNSFSSVWKSLGVQVGATYSAILNFTNNLGRTTTNDTIETPWNFKYPVSNGIGSGNTGRMEMKVKFLTNP